MVSASWMIATLLAQQPAVEPGLLPKSWATGGPNCLELPDWQVHEYNADFFILRESGCSHYEKPFLYLIFGEKRALLEDTGAGKTEVAKVVTGLMEKWAARRKATIPPLLVVHSHSHGDHTAGDAQFAALANTELIKAGTPLDPVIDLGNRNIDVIPIPGHDTASLAFYDRKTGILLTGDSLYPGRLYVRDIAAFTASARKLVEFTEDKPVAHILGTHIEQSRTPFTDYKVGTRYQPDEHSLELSRGDLLELDQALTTLKGKPVRVILRNFTIVPRFQLP
jgi:glyoxylase-like metal-dependent hydrolase (beta-lactamase superfamily II)